ncbi:EAL domain-containing protein [uncultured Paenalcaligenes sp.]|uniref:EAL domain-containing response regulator n=1 Tax=uncultured Paenalcaligenes sp. TaxID=1588925 RepID=UPI00260EDAD6|nr:EAL domain-containing protein [uncultured Paenalcaligenes sp.]
MTIVAQLFSEADILVVDDNPVNVELLMDLLEDEGYTNIEGMCNPLQVEDRVQRQRPDLILLDIRMPGLSGLELLQRLNHTMGDKAPAVIILTAQIDETTRHDALELGVQDFLTKPFNHIEVLQRIHNTLQLQRLLVERTERANLLEELVQARTTELAIRSRQDPVTELPNRHVILEHLLTLQSDKKDAFAFFIALEGLDEIARLHGYEVVDQTLCKTSLLLNSITEIPIALLGVWGSDKWVVLCEDSSTPALSVALIAQCLLDTIQAPLRLGQLLLHVRARIGISQLHPSDSPEQTIRRAAVALPSTDGLWQCYSQELEDALMRKIHVRDALHQAIEGNEFHLLYQPKVDVRNGQVRGVEALLRWESPVLGRVSPVEFIPAAEASGDIIHIGKWVIKQAIQAISRWREQQQVDEFFTVAVNVASSQLMQHDFAEWLIKTVSQSGLPPYVLEIEVTESGLMQDMQLAMRQLQALSQAGLRIAIDDFGTGYSSLAYLKVLPVSVLKIDRAFIKEMHCNAQDQRLTSTVIDMARHFEFMTVAEGVEESAQLNLLRAMGCDLVQGFIFSPPLNESTMLKLAATGFSQTDYFKN